MKLSKRFVAIMLCVVFMFGSVTLVQAHESRYSVIPTIGTPVEAVGTGRKPLIATKGATGISEYGFAISNVGTTVYFSGETYATHLSSKIGNSIISVEVWNGYDWITYCTTNKFVYDAYFCTASFSTTVTGGKYYRTTGQCYAVINGVTYSYYSSTGYIYVN